jgi:hypothetical protein
MLASCYAIVANCWYSRLMVSPFPFSTRGTAVWSLLLLVGCARELVVGEEETDETTVCDRCAVPDVGTPGSTTGPTDVSTTGSTSPDDSTGDDPDPVAGECVVHEDCASGYCLSYQDAPPDPEATCETPPANMATRFTGRVLNVETFAVLPNTTVDVVSVLDAITNPVGATPLASALTDDAGRFDTTSRTPLSAAIAVVARITAPGHARSITGVASPTEGSYEPGNAIHDLWAIPEMTIEAWSSALSADPALAEHLPLVERGGIVAVVRDRTTGTPLPNATLAPVDDGSSLHILYLDAAGTGFQTSGTASRGIAVILGAPTTGTSFELIHEGMPTGTTVQVGSSNNAIFVVAVDLQ